MIDDPLLNNFALGLLIFVVVVIFYGIGLGLFGRLSLTAAVAGALVFFILQIFLSRWWLRRARFGPAEWLWRMFTYRRRIPLFGPE